MTKILSLITVFFITAWLGVSPVAAHVLITNDSIGATLHIDPDDDPIAGALTSFFLEFKDTENKFQLSDCRCQAFVYQNGNEIYFTSLKAVNENSPLSSSFQFKFPAKGTYELLIKGAPVSAGAFNEFEMRETIAVEREDADAVAAINASNLLSHWPKIVGILGIFIFMIVTTIVSKRQIAKPSLAED
jgi:hypothetical protein